MRKKIFGKHVWQYPAEMPERKVEVGLGLEKGYGLIISGSECIILTDGKKVKKIKNDKIGEERIGFYNEFFFDGNELYYTKGEGLYKWPSVPMRDFGGRIYGIAKCDDEIIVSIIKDGHIDSSTGRIANSMGKILFDNFNEPFRIAVFNNELYYTSEKKGFFKTPSTMIQYTKGWVEGLTVLDKVYFGGLEGIIYSYDGIKVEEVYNTEFPIRGLHAVKENENRLIYATGSGREGRGILVIPLDNPLNAEKILEDKIEEGTAICSLPLDFMEKMGGEEI